MRVWLDEGFIVMILMPLGCGYLYLLLSFLGRTIDHPSE